MIVAAMIVITLLILWIIRQGIRVLNNWMDKLFL